MTNTDHEGHSQKGHGGPGGHRWMMIARCIPIIVIVAPLIAVGAISAVWVLFAVACVGMMAMMMRGMNHGGHDGTPINNGVRR